MMTLGRLWFTFAMLFAMVGFCAPIVGWRWPRIGNALITYVAVAGFVMAVVGCVGAIALIWVTP